MNINPEEAKDTTRILELVYQMVTALHNERIAATEKLKEEVKILEKLEAICNKEIKIAKEVINSSNRHSIDLTGIDELGLCRRTHDTLVRANIKTVADILNQFESKDQFLMIRNIGPKAAEEIIDKVRAFGYPNFLAQ